MRLSPLLVNRVLGYLGLGGGAPDREFLGRLLLAYSQRVPWESASRVVRAAAVPVQIERPRWPNQFWDEAVELGLGGTCFESNYAFHSLLTTLGFEATLTINNMGDTVGCHTAVLVALAGQRLVADVGFPVHVPVPLNPAAAQSAPGPYLDFTALPVRPGAFEIQRAPHPKPYCFTLVATPVAESRYRAAVTRDYGPEGYFLREVTINKIVDGRMWRFTTRDEQPYLECYHDGAKTDYALTGDRAAIADAVAARFGMPPGLLRESFERVGYAPRPLTASGMRPV